MSQAFDLNHNRGYYLIGDQVFFNKIEAVRYASQTKQPIVYKFHDDIFSSIDWSIRPPGTLQEMYRERAQQIRDKYDYIIIYFSGGADSWTVLNSFLANGIRVDEVFTRRNSTERKYKDADPNNRNEVNLASEYEYAVLPVLEHIRKNFPEIKITIDDVADVFEKTEIEESQVLSMDRWHTMTATYKYNRRSDDEAVQESHLKTIGVVVGADKIKCVAKDGKYFAFFSDVAQADHLSPGREAELFYWTPDMPQLPILQAHCVMEHYKENDVKNAIVTGVQKSITDYTQMYRHVCYPDYNPDTFQVDKPYGSLVWQSEAWLHKHNPKFSESWAWATKELYKGVNEQYINRLPNNLVVGLKPIPSRPYYL